jgi:hypothetical protein
MVRGKSEGAQNVEFVNKKYKELEPIGSLLT